MPVVESSISLNFPDNNYFRIGECDGYKSIQNNFAEMDACWYDQANDILYIIELKDWGDNKLLEESDPSYSEAKIAEMKKGISKYRISNLLKKSVDTTCMYMSILLDKKEGLEIQKCSPFSITKNTSIKLLSIINWTELDTSYVSNINTEYKSKFNSYAKLFDIKVFLVLTKTQASLKFNWIS